MIELLILICLSFVKSKVVFMATNQHETKVMVKLLYYTNEHFHTYSVFNTFLSYNIFTCFKSELVPSKIIQNETLYLDQNYSATLYQMNVTTKDDISISNLSTYIIEEQPLVRDAGIALGYHLKNESFSIVHQLYKDKVIDHLQFAFEDIDKYLLAAFYLGGIPNDTHLSLPYKGLIKVREELPTWGFNLNGLIYNNTEYKLNIPCIINSAATNMITSDEIYEMMINSILKEFIDNKTCEVSETEEPYKFQFVKCNKKIYEKEEIEFIFDYVKIKFPIKSLFNRHSNYFLIHSNSKKPGPIHNFTGAILGIDFINKFNVSLFDYEKKQVEFYSDTNIMTEIKDICQSQITPFLFAIGAIICIVNIVVLSKKRKEIEEEKVLII